VTEAVDPFGSVMTNLNDATGVNDPEAGRAALADMVKTAFTAEDADADAAMDRAAEALARATRTTPEEARKQLDTWREEYQATVAKAEAAALEAADAARKAASAAGIISVIALVWGACRVVRRPQLAAALGPRFLRWRWSRAPPRDRDPVSDGLPQ
jgi:acyl-CoA reductase-like NAD-dependent aldehyde dehydrogenase